MYGTLHADAAHFYVLSDVFKLENHVGHGEYHRATLEMVLLQVQMHVGFAIDEEQQAGFGQLIDLALVKEGFV